MRRAQPNGTVSRSVLTSLTSFPYRTERSEATGEDGGLDQTRSERTVREGTRKVSDKKRMTQAVISEIRSFTCIPPVPPAPFMRCSGRVSATQSHPPFTTRRRRERSGTRSATRDGEMSVRDACHSAPPGRSRTVPLLAHSVDLRSSSHSLGPVVSLRPPSSGPRPAPAAGEVSGVREVRERYVNDERTEGTWGDDKMMTTKEERRLAFPGPFPSHSFTFRSHLPSSQA